YSCFMRLSLPLRILPSFPTRRSSDLNATMVTPALSVAGWGLHWMSMVIFPIPPRGVLVGQDSVKTVLRCGGLVMVIRVTDILLRSEEHTSELQSRENLVCRLLLEKKK